MKRSLIALGIVAIAASIAHAGAAEYKPPAKRVSPQDGLVAQVKPKGATPRMADGKPDLSGYWAAIGPDAPYTGFEVRGLKYFEPDQVVMQRGNAWSRPLYKPEFWEKVYNTDFSKVGDDPAFNCGIYGVPRMNMPHHIVQSAKELVTLNQVFSATVRFIPIDGRKRDPNDSDNEAYTGVPLGHWEGDTLVIESVGFNDVTWFQWTGYFHSNAMKVTERLRRDGDLLFYQFTVDDPQVLVRPWTSEMFVRRLVANPAMRAEEAPPCTEMDVDEIPDEYHRG